MEVHVACIAEKKPHLSAYVCYAFFCNASSFISTWSTEESMFLYLIENVICNINIEA